MLEHDKDAPLRENVRLFGRLLRDAVRDHEAHLALERILDEITRSETIHIIRAFSYFSRLANIAEDQRHISRARLRSQEGAPRPDTLRAAVEGGAGGGRPDRQPAGSAQGAIRVTEQGDDDSQIQPALIRGWQGRRSIRPSSMRCSQSQRRGNQGAKPLIGGLQTVQTNRATTFRPKDRRA